MADDLLVVDFGTSYFKLAIVGADGTIRHLHRVPTPIVTMGDQREIAVDSFRAVMTAALRDLAAKSASGLREIRGITFSTQANTFTLLDADERPLTPFIVWDDTRAKALLPVVSAWGHEPGFSARTGVPLLGHQFSMAKIKWLADQSPAYWKDVRSISYLGDYFCRWLTGVHALDGSVATLTGLFDVQQWKWIDAYCERASLPSKWLPKVVKTGERVGAVKQNVAAELGLPAGCPFFMGVLDQYAGAFGSGNTSAGDVSETTGTVLATVRCAADFAAPSDNMIFRGPAPVPGHYYHMIFGDVSANLLEFYRNQLPDRPSFEELDRQANEAAASIPLELDQRIGGEELKKQISEIAKREPRGRVMRCIYTTVTKALADQVNDLTGSDRPTKIHSAGGGANSRLWLKIKSDLLGVPCIAPTTPEPALRGAALIAARNM